MIYGYVRVACKDEDTSRREQLQEDILREAGAQVVFRETGIGYNNHPELDKLMEITQPGDSVTVTKMVSLSRNFAEYCRVKEAFRAKGVKIHSLETLLDPALMGSLLIENYGSIYNAIATQYLENKLNYRKKNKMTGDNKKEDV